jgi:hypothetical protein
MDSRFGQFALKIHAAQSRGALHRARDRPVFSGCGCLRNSGQQSLTSIRPLESGVRLERRTDKSSSTTNTMGTASVMMWHACSRQAEQKRRTSFGRLQSQSAAGGADNERLPALAPSLCGFSRIESLKSQSISSGLNPMLASARRWRTQLFISGTVTKPVNDENSQRHPGVKGRRTTKGRDDYNNDSTTFRGVSPAHAILAG